ncbi:MAG: methionyl-tRNA formyltransferase [Elusimicrobia bacterium]|nr:methionyl-tRNA formyltransferase [Elusimicrobiota bacterium]
MLNTVFFGTPPIAVPFLERLASLTRVRGVVTAPDRPVGRGYALTPPAVKTAAQKLGLSVLQPTSPKELDLAAAFGPLDVGVVVAYGYLLPPAVFNAPRHGLVNAHFSLVPKFRGAGPIQWALIRGETETGVSLFRIEKGLDTGPVFLQKTVPIRPEDNAATLRERLTAEGVELLGDFVRKIGSSSWEPSPQIGEWTEAPLLKKEDGRVFWDRHSAREILNLVRGTYEWPGATARIQGARLKIRAGEARAHGNGRPGEIVAVEKGRGFLVKCVSDSLLVTRVQPEGKREMDAESYWNGARLAVGHRFEQEA